MRHAGHGILYVGFEPVEIVRVELETEVLRHRIVRRDPMCATVPFVWPQVEAVLFLPEVVRDVDIAHQGQLAAAFPCPGSDFGNLLGQEVLVAHHHHRNRPSSERHEPLADPLRVVSCSINDAFAADVALFGVDDPFAVPAANAGCGRETQNLSTHVACARCERLRQLRRIDVAVRRVVKYAFQVMGFHEGIHGLRLVGRENLDVDSLVTAHSAGPMELLHPLP